MIKNWRPISLIIIDAKIASKVLALRMQKVLASIINYDQTAYVRGRYIVESIRLVSDILEFIEENSIGGILFSTESEKAFDSIEHPFLLAVLKLFGFGPQFIHWVRTIFKNAESFVMNSGHSTSDVSSLETIFQSCATFQLYSSLKLNLEKSEVCWIGNRMGSDERPINCRLVDIKCSVIRTLGIFNS